MRRSRDVSRSFVPDSGLLCAECRLRHTVLRETWEEQFERPVPNFVVDFCSPLFLKDCVAVYSQDVVDAANSHTLSEEGDSGCDASTGNCGDLPCSARRGSSTQEAASRSFT